MKKTSGNGRPPLERWYGLAIVLFLGFAIADLLIISYRDLMLPNQGPSIRIKPPPPSPVLGRDAFQIIIRRNILSSSDQIPPDILGEGVDPNQRQKEEIPILSQLPLSLIGTLVHSNPEKSLAAIELKNKSNQVLSYPPKREIDGIATVEKVERAKVIIRNINTGRLEFLEMKSASKLSFGAAPPTNSAGDSKDVKKLAPNKFEISRQDLNKYTSDIGNIVMQARAVPARKPGSGEIYGWRLLEIQPNSIYTQLGLQVMDVITGVNGSPVTSAQQAMEMYGALKNSGNIKIKIERGGRTETLDYTIK
jgi:general secretion pathway protein C